MKNININPGDTVIYGGTTRDKSWNLNLMAREYMDLDDFIRWQGRDNGAYITKKNYGWVK